MRELLKAIIRKLTFVFPSLQIYWCLYEWKIISIFIYFIYYMVSVFCLIWENFNRFYKCFYLLFAVSLLCHHLVPKLTVVSFSIRHTNLFLFCGWDHGRSQKYPEHMIRIFSIKCLLSCQRFFPDIYLFYTRWPLKRQTSLYLLQCPLRTTKKALL